MTQQVLLQLGVGGIFVVLVLRIVLIDFLGKGAMGQIAGGSANAQMFKLLRAIEKDVRELHAWHAPNDDGEQNWKNTRMISLLEKLNDTIDHNTQVIERLANRASK